MISHTGFGPIYSQKKDPNIIYIHIIFSSNPYTRFNFRITSRPTSIYIKRSHRKTILKYKKRSQLSYPSLNRQVHM